jgi:hypothetical protein
VSLNRYAARRDANEDALVSLVEELGGYFVKSGPLDGWLFHRGSWRPVEVKNPKGRDRVTRSQEIFIGQCVHIGAPHLVWHDEEDVLNSLGAK